MVYLLTRIGNGSKKAKNNVFLLIAFFILFFVAATREMTIGNDTPNYLRLFKNCDIYKWHYLSINSYYEEGFVVFNILLSYLHISPRLFLAIMAFIFSFAAYKFIKDNSNNYLMSVLLFINLLFFYQSMTMLRQFLAFSIIILFGFKYVKEKKLLRYILTIVFASLFHSSAVLAVFIFPLYHMKYSRKTVLLITIGSIVMALFLTRIYPLIASFLDKGTYYMERIGDIKIGNLIAMVMFLLMYVFSLIVIKKEKRQDYSFYLYALLFSAAIYFVSINMSVLNRATQYYAIFSIIALPNIVEANMKESKLIVESIIIGLFILYSSVIMYSKPEWNSAYNYKTCLFQEEGYICE